MMLGLTGTFAAGKGTVAEYFIGKGFQYYSLSDELRLLLREKGIMPTRDNLIEAGNELRRKYGNSFLANLVIKRLRGGPRGTDVIIDSIRNTGEIAALKELKGFFLVSVDAPVDIRYGRAMKRASVRDPKSFSEFLVQEKREMAGKGSEQQLAACMSAADFKLVNDGDYRKLYKLIEKVLGEAKAKNAHKDAA